MILIIMRHGEAVPYQADDKSRALTRFGAKQASNAGKRLAQFFIEKQMPASIDHVLVSPYLRTQQTFDEVAAHVNFKNRTDTNAITPVADERSVQDLIDGFALGDAQGKGAPEQLMLVSHMPLVSLLSDKLCTGFNGKIFDTADILIIDYDADTHIGTQMAFLRSMHQGMK
uniref:phosphohistidine phosphatase SixA n=1 Tax=Ningiella ruwaisensis TaxID=2364274 RepID=UPI00109F1DE2|nr:phosphohistidine phosphatase SixA [Ningiella ruwaisensis]